MCFYLEPPFVVDHSPENPASPVENVLHGGDRGEKGIVLNVSTMIHLRNVIKSRSYPKSSLLPISLLIVRDENREESCGEVDDVDDPKVEQFHDVARMYVVIGNGLKTKNSYFTLIFLRR